MYWEFAFLLLPIAAGSGWWFGWAAAKKNTDDSNERLSSEYFKGLNFLINEQPDQAADIFLKMLDVNSENLEVHYALASLFQKRGEVDRAIRIHQNLIARPSLTVRQKNQTLFYLAQNYQRAGVLDRAEALFVDLIMVAELASLALQALLSIYQQEKEWLRAIDISKQLQKRTRASYSKQISHYYCEMADSHADGSTQRNKLIKQALQADKTCARANALQGNMLYSSQYYSKALKSFHRVVQQDAALIPEVLPRMLSCWNNLSRLDEALSYLDTLMATSPSFDILYLYIGFVGRLSLGDALDLKLSAYIVSFPSLRGVLSLLQMSDPLRNEFITSQSVKMLERLDDKMHDYHCLQCGFSGHLLHWQCPACQRWDSVRRVNEIEL